MSYPQASPNPSEIMIDESQTPQCNICFHDTDLNKMTKAGAYIKKCACIYDYHPYCLDQWFQNKSQIMCPVCKHISDQRVQNYFTNQLPINSFIDRWVDNLAELFEIWVKRLFLLSANTMVQFFTVHVVIFSFWILFTFILLPYFLFVGFRYLWLNQGIARHNLPDIREILMVVM